MDVCMHMCVRCTNTNITNIYMYMYGLTCAHTHIYIYIYITCVCPLSASAMRLRLVTTAEFIEVNGASPITQIAGFSPWRTFL